MIHFSQSEGHPLRQRDDNLADEIHGSHLDIPVDIGRVSTLQASVQHQKVEVQRVPVRGFGISRNVSCKQIKSSRDKTWLKPRPAIVGGDG